MLRPRPRPDVQDQDQDRHWSETGLVIRPRSQTTTLAFNPWQFDSLTLSKIVSTELTVQA